MRGRNLDKKVGDFEDGEMQISKAGTKKKKR